MNSFAVRNTKNKAKKKKTERDERRFIRIKLQFTSSSVRTFTKRDIVARLKHGTFSGPTSIVLFSYLFKCLFALTYNFFFPFALLWKFYQRFFVVAVFFLFYYSVIRLILLCWSRDKVNEQKKNSHRKKKNICWCAGST